MTAGGKMHEILAKWGLVAARIREDGGIHGVEATVATVEDVFDLQGMATVKDSNKRFLR